MSSPAATRATALAELLSSRSSLLLPWSDLLRLETYLREAFGIAQFPSGTDWAAAVNRSCDPVVAKEYWKVNARRARLAKEAKGPFPHAVESKFYDLISSPPLSGLVHSLKYPIIFDLAALLAAIVEAMGGGRSALDLGCNAGYHALWLSQTASLERVVGIDRSAGAIRQAQGVASGMRGRTELQFVRGSFPADAPGGRFDLIYSLDGALNYHDAASWSAAEGALEDGGVLVWAGGSIEAELPHTNLACVGVDVCGGWSGLEFTADRVMVFVKGARASAERVGDSEATRYWEETFKPWANSGVVPRWKTQAFCRAWHKYGPAPQ